MRGKRRLSSIDSEERCWEEVSELFLEDLERSGHDELETFENYKQTIKAKLLADKLSQRLLHGYHLLLKELLTPVS
jgi:hypothetical protein